MLSKVVVQASSEHSVCFAVSGTEGERARGVLRAKFADAIRAGRIQDVDVERNCAVLAAVGQRMAANRGVAAKFFDALATAGVNIKAMAQGSSEYNITVMVEQVRVRGMNLILFSLLVPSCRCELEATAWVRAETATVQQQLLLLQCVSERVPWTMPLL